MKVTLVMVTSSDGYIASDEYKYSFKWNSREDKTFFKKITKEIGTVLMGSNTFKQNREYVLPERLNIIVTKNPKKFKKQENLIFMSGKPEEIVSKLEKMGIKHIALLGGREINSQFLKAGLIDDGYITVEPIKFGDGIKIFDSEYKAEVVKKEIMNEGGTELNYVEFK